MEINPLQDPVTLIRHINGVSRAIQALVGPVLEKELSLHYKELLVLRVVSGGLQHPGQISEHLSLPAPTTTRLLDSLIEAGHLRRELDPQDRRKLQIHLTDQGRSTLQTALNLARTLIQDKFNPVPSDFITEAIGTLQKLEDYLGMEIKP
ncbi:MarR family winged helix-turn-helix transcriptional regulator [Deinococcus roseus]|uniref:HTH marR-type domain-containing protein n=1 Tax=Deinococcus roseus TaxID=392414 RepID=A0ABQ2D1I8_9DEIO|nr:MarR family transcriptional regulator [Deinococcus roseus]GGJ38840.1 hypothetical protein GCM10008938_26150 [Deinococcus roseus]